MIDESFRDLLLYSDFLLFSLRPATQADKGKERMPFMVIDINTFS